jgi:flagellum-specific peptidoglycan hydrolase FlgJ
MESDYMKYSGDGASYTITNEAKFKADVTRAYNTAVKFFAMKCRQYGWNPQEKMSNGLHRVFSHDEGRRLGLSSAHVDPTHIWDRYGWTMDKFRSDVVVEMGLTTAPVDETKYYRVRVAWDMPETQLGAFIAKENAIANCPSGYSVFDNDGKLVYENNTVTTVYPTGVPLSKEDFITKVANIAIELYKETAILPSVITAQCCLETGFGLGSDSNELV